MKLRQLLITLILVYFITPNLHAIHTDNPRAKQILAKIQQLPEMRQLIQEVETDGNINLLVQNMPSANFDAFWDSGNRYVRINEAKNEQEGVFICSLIFELHNASTDRQFKQLYQLAQKGLISKDAYVERVERMEHQNALRTSTLLEKGIRQGFFEKDARWIIFKDFNDHYKVQQIHGHSDWIAGNYDRLRHQQSGRFKGTLAASLTDQDKQNMMRYMKIKDDLTSSVDDRVRKGMQALQSECAHASNRHLTLMREVFQNNPTFESVLKSTSKSNTAAQN